MFQAENSSKSSSQAQHFVKALIALHQLCASSGAARTYLANNVLGQTENQKAIDAAQTNAAIRSISLAENSRWQNLGHIGVEGVRQLITQAVKDCNSDAVLSEMNQQFGLREDCDDPLAGAKAYVELARLFKFGNTPTLEMSEMIRAFRSRNAPQR